MQETCGSEPKNGVYHTSNVVLYCKENHSISDFVISASCVSST